MKIVIRIIVFDFFGLYYIYLFNIFYIDRCVWSFIKDFCLRREEEGRKYYWYIFLFFSVQKLKIFVIILFFRIVERVKKKDVCL